MLITDSSQNLETSFLSSTSSILYDSWESVDEKSQCHNDSPKHFNQFLDSIPHFNCVKPVDYNNYSSLTSPTQCSTPVNHNSNDLIKISNRKLDELIGLVLNKKASSCQCMCKSGDSVSSLSSIESQEKDKPFISESLRNRSNHTQFTTIALNQKRDELYKTDKAIRENWEKLKRTKNVLERKSTQNQIYEPMDTIMPYEYNDNDLMNSKKIRFIYGTDKSLEEAVLNSSLKSYKDNSRNITHNNRVKFNDTIEFYDPSRQNRAIYSLEEFAHLKANPNFTKPSNIVSWEDLASRSHDEGKVIPIEIETNNESRKPMVELCYKEKISIPSHTSTTKQEPLYSYIEPKLIKSQNKPNLNSYYDDINKVNQSKYLIRDESNEYTTIDNLMNSSLGLTADESLTQSETQQKVPMVHKYRTHSNDNYLDFKPMRFDRTFNSVKPSDNSPVSFTISSQPKKTYRSRGIVKIKTSDNLNTQPLIPAIPLRSPVMSPIEREISFYKNPTSSQFPRQIPIEHVYQENQEKQKLKEQESLSEENDYMTIESENQTASKDSDLGFKTSSTVNSSKLQNSTEIKNDLNESVSEYLNKSKVFNQSGKVLDELYNQQRSSSKVHRRSSRIGDENNEKELNTIFKRIYNRHRFSLTNENQKPGIRRVSNTSNLTTF